MATSRNGKGVGGIFLACVLALALASCGGSDPKAVIDADVEITGTVGQTIAEKKVTLTLKDAQLADTLPGGKTDDDIVTLALKSDKKKKVSGLGVAAVRDGDDKLNLTISGPATEAYDEEAVLVIGKNMLKSGKALEASGKKISLRIEHSGRADNQSIVSVVKDGALEGGDAVEVSYVLTDALKTAQAEYSDVTAEWFTDLPAGLKAEYKSDAADLSRITVKYTVAATASAAASAAVRKFAMTVPGRLLSGEKPIGIADALLFFVRSEAPEANLTGDDVNGKMREALDGSEVTVTLSGEVFATAITNEDVIVAQGEGEESAYVLSSFFTNLPKGMRAELAAPVAMGDNSMRIKFAGTPTAANDGEYKAVSEAIAYTVPASFGEGETAVSFLTGTAGITGDRAKNNNGSATAPVKFDIAAPAYAEVGEATVSGVVGVEDSTGVKLNITLKNGVFVVISEAEGIANDDVTEWFTGIPSGMAAKATAHAEESSAIEVTISGTPATAKSGPLVITIGKDWIKDATADLTVDANEKAVWDIVKVRAVPDGLPYIGYTKYGDGEAATWDVDGSCDIVLLGDYSFKEFIENPAGEGQVSNDVTEWFTLPADCFPESGDDAFKATASRDADNGKKVRCLTS